MKITSVEISNFKAIERTRLDLHPTFNVLVGANGSGKSSVLQALHWMFQSGRNLSIEPKKGDTASTLSEKDAIYMPSPDYRNAGHATEYGNTHGKPQLGVTVVAKTDEGSEVTAEMWLKAARNEGISVHVPTGNTIVSHIRDQSREFSAYIPGVAGIPLNEEKRSKLLVHRSAAAGDANTVLRNMLDLLRRVTVNGRSGLEVVESLVSQVMGDFSLKVDFDDEKHTRVMATFRTGDMRDEEDKAYRPLELAGIGYLQVLQIFSYLVYFRPVVLLVDEPDAHLYPIAQERLVKVLAQAAQDFDSQILLTTHSPSIVRALPSESQVIWMRDGEVQPEGDIDGRLLMGWGLLDRKIVLLTEDTNTDMLRSILAQWPDIERATAIWPFHGSSNIPPADAIDGLKALLGADVRLVIHRDRDFLMPDEVEKIAKPYEDRGHRFWATKYSDIEAYWATPEVIASHFDVTHEEASNLLANALAEAVKNDDQLKKRRKKRSEALSKINRDGSLRHFGDEEVRVEAEADGSQFGVLGKTMIGRIREAASAASLDRSESFGKDVPETLERPIADDLRVLLESPK